MRLWNLAVVLKDRAAWQRLSKHPPPPFPDRPLFPFLEAGESHSLVCVCVCVCVRERERERD